MAATDTESPDQGDSSDQTDSDTDESASQGGVVGYVRYDLAKDLWDPNGLYELDLEVPDDFAKSDLVENVRLTVC